MAKNGHLTLYENDLVELCKKYGTPLFVFDEKVLEENFARISKAFGDSYKKMICYSIKTNNNLAICHVLKQCGASAEVSSEFDLTVALKAGFRGDDTIFDGPFKPKEAMKRAIAENIRLINVESFTELERLNSIAGEMGVKQAIGIRINPFENPKITNYLRLHTLTDAAYFYLGSRFGFSLNDAFAAFKRAKELSNLNVEGIMTHPYHSATKCLLPIVRRVHSELGIEIKFFNIGGGFSPGVNRERARYVGLKEFIFDFLRRKMRRKSKSVVNEHAPSLENTANFIVEEMKRGLRDLPEPTIIVEPGRFITASAGTLLVKVDHVKKAGGYNWVMVDGGSNIVPNPGNTELHEVCIANKMPDQLDQPVNVVGPMLYAEDFFAFQSLLPTVSEADILLISGCGAYTLSMSNQFLHPRPNVILVNSKEVKVIREKETFEDCIRKDKYT
jgi:diaminopimelate decarboxylase